MKIECLESDFCVPKAWKKWKKINKWINENSYERKSQFWSWKKRTPSKLSFQVELLFAIFIFFISNFRLLLMPYMLMLTMLSTKSCFSCPVLVAYKLVAYKVYFQSHFVGAFKISVCCKYFDNELSHSFFFWIVENSVHGF